MSSDWYREHRPRLFKYVRGQEDAIACLQSMLKEEMPHVLLLTGPSGVGKTTAAQIIAKKLGCHERCLREYNMADKGGVDTAREITEGLRGYPLFGSIKVILLDEFHQATTQAQNLLLIPFENTPDFVFFILCSSEPAKIINTIQTRCTSVVFKSMSHDALEETVRDVMKAKGVDLNPEVLTKLCNSADGSARRAIVTLQKIAKLSDEEEQLSVIERNDPQADKSKLFRMLLYGKVSWKEIGKALKDLSGEEPEAIRRYILACANNTLLGAENVTADFIIRVFRGSAMYDGMAAITSNCYEVYRYSRGPKRK